MSYKCDIHGDLESDFCEGCGFFIRCDHSDTDSTEKTIIYGTDRGEFIVTIYLDFCKTCGETIDVHF